MKKITPKLSTTLKVALLLSFLGLQFSNAQDCTPVGDQSAYGQDQWIGYVYNNIDNSNIPASVAFDPTNYKGYITRPQVFNMDLDYYQIPDESTLCSGYYNNNFAVRYKMQQTLPAGYYTYTVGGDDGFRLSLDGGATFADDLSYWDDHVYVSKTATHYHAGGVINYVLEYYEHDGLSRVSFANVTTSCSSTAPTAITGVLTSSCATGTTLTATGGIAGTDSTYQWGIGAVVGQNVISGQTGVSIDVHPLSTKTYWVRRLSAAPCSSYTDGVTATVTVEGSAPGDPSVFGNNVWNVYTYIGTDIDLVQATTQYAGYYTAPTLGTNTQDYWNRAASPSSYSGYQGCPVPNDQFTFIQKRKGFPCGTYAIAMENWDDASRLYINGVQVWYYGNWSGGAPVQNIGTYTLDANSTIELRTEEGGGDANAKLTITPINGSTGPVSVSGVTFCCKNATVILTATGGVLAEGAHYQWGTGAVIGNNVIEGETGATITLLVPATTTFWVRIKNPGENCYTDGVTKILTVPDPIVYNGSWNGTPSIETAVEIQTNLVMQSDLQFCSCQVKNNATVTVKSGNTLTVKNKLTVDTGSNVIVENDAALLQIEKTQDEGSIVSHRNSNPLYRLDYTLWASPVANQNLLAFSPNTSTNRFYEYKYDINPSTGQMREQYFTVDPATTNFATAKSYLIRMPNTGTAAYNAGTESYALDGAFKGVPNNADVTIALSTQGDRYTAVGNPYASPISVVDFFNTNNGVIDGSSALYFWRKKNNTDVSSYATLTLAGYTANGASGTQGYQAGGQAMANFYSGANSNWVISQGQGFLVQTKVNATSSTLNFNNAMRRKMPASGTQSFLRSENAPSRLWLNLEGTTGGFSQAAVAYMEEATTGLDYGYDGKQLGGDLTLYSLAEETALAIQARPQFSTSDIVPMGFKIATPGSFTITLDHTEGVFTDGQTVYLKDNLLGLVHNLSESSYTFATEAGTFDTRFEVQYTADSALGTATPVLTSNSVIIYQQGTAINIQAGTATISTLTIYDISGRRLYSKSGINSTEASVSNLEAAHEVLIVEVATDKGTVSKKIVY